MDKSGDCDSDGSISWEDFFGSSTDLLPTLLTMYDTLIAQTLSNDQEVNSTAANILTNGGSESDPYTKNVTLSTETEKGENSLLSMAELNRNSVNTTSTNCISSNNNILRTMVSSKNVVNQRNGVLSRSFPRWSTREVKSIKGKQTMMTMATATEQNGLAQFNVKGQSHLQRPLSVNSTLSSTSSSSSCSESSMSLSNGLGIAPRASPEEEDSMTIPDADMSEDEQQVNNYRCAKSTDDQIKRTERCCKSSTSKDCGENGPRSRTISFPIQAQGRPRFYDPNLSYMDRVVMEIVETERIYVNDLCEIISGYLEYWGLHQGDSPPFDDIKELFSNIEEIHKFNGEFLSKLEGCGLNPIQVARCFVTKNEGFSIYTQYCTNYPRTMSLLTDMMRQEQLAKSFRERQASLAHTLPLGSYLLKPVQRILKYHLLLQNIVKHYDHEADGYETIVEALSAMTNIAHHINDMKRRHEHAVRVQEIQSLLYSWQGEDLTTYGELCAEGTFRVYGAKALRHVFLFDKMLLITKKKEDGILSYKSHIMAVALMLIESVPGEPLSFHVIPFDNPRLQCTLQARNLEQKREWTLQIKRVILENYQIQIPIHARQLVMELGQCRQEGNIITSEKIQTKRQHSAPEYLERRKQEKGRKTESSLKAKLRRDRKSDPISPKESPAAARRSRRTSVDSARDRSESRDRDVGIDRKMSSASCPPSTEKRLVKKLSGWRRKSEPGFYLSSGVKSWKGNGLMSRKQCPTLLTALDSNESIGEEGGEIESSELDLCIQDIDETDDIRIPNVEERRESVEEIVGQLVMQNHDFQRILSKQRLVHLRKALAQHQQRHLHEEEETASETETEEPPMRTRGSVGLDVKKVAFESGSQTSSSNGIGSSSDMHEMSTENIACGIEPGDDCILASKNVQRTVSDPGNKATLTPRRFISGPFAHYDPLSLLWSSFRRTDNHRKEGNGEIKSTREKTTNIRHTHSFTCSRKESIPSPGAEQLQLPKESLPHGGDSGIFPNSFTSDSSSSSEANIPTLPAVWLKQQAGHLATPNNKSGSLPRSFQVTSQAPSSAQVQQIGTSSGSPLVKARLRDGRYADRPFTIASDKPSPTDMTLDEMEQHMSKFNDQNNTGNSTITNGEDFDDLSTPVMQSMENISLHPDHKIYRSSKSSIKHMLLSVTQRLAGLKVNVKGNAGINSGKYLPVVAAFGSHPNITPVIGGEPDITLKSEEPHQECRKSLKQKMKLALSSEDRDSDSENCCESVACSSGSSGFGSLGSCGSSTNNLTATSKKIGARLAQCEQPDDYALSKLLGSALNESLSRRPHSVMSMSSTTTTASSSSTDDKFGESPQVGHRSAGRKAINHRDLYLSYIDQDPEILSDSDASADSFYERSFEAIENLLENEIFPDSAIYSDDPDESYLTTPNSPGSRTINWTMSNYVADLNENSPLSVEYSDNITNQNRLPPPPVPIKPPLSPQARLTRSRLVRSQVILEKLRHLEQCSTHFQREDLPSPSFEGIKSIRERRKELDLWKIGGGTREDESETSSQHSTSTINTVIELSPSKSTSFPSSRRCSDTESSGGNSPLTERAVSRSSCRSQSQGHLSDPMPKGWVKLVVGKLEAET